MNQMATQVTARMTSAATEYETLNQGFRRNQYFHPSKQSYYCIELSTDLFGHWTVSKFCGSNRRLEVRDSYPRAFACFLQEHERRLQCGYKVVS